MNNRDKSFKGQQTNEILICFFRKHWITLTKDLTYFLVFLFTIIYVFKYSNEIQSAIVGNKELKLFFFVSYSFATFFVHKFFVNLFNYFINIGLITNLRVIDHQKSLFFNDSVDAIDMAQIQNIERIREGVFPNILGYGNIKIFLNASSGIKTFETLPNVKFHFRCLSRQKEARRLADLQTSKNYRQHQKIKDNRTQTVNIPIKNDTSNNREIGIPFGK